MLVGGGGAGSGRLWSWAQRAAWRGDPRSGHLPAQLHRKAVGAARALPHHGADTLWPFLWVGGHTTPVNLTVALCSHCDSIPVSTFLLRDTCGMTSTDLAQSLARKTNKQVLVSNNLQNTDSNFTLPVKHRIKEETEAFPEKF